MVGRRSRKASRLLIITLLGNGIWYPRVLSIVQSVLAIGNDIWYHRVISYKVLLNLQVCMKSNRFPSLNHAWISTGKQNGYVNLLWLCCWVRTFNMYIIVDSKMEYTISWTVSLKWHLLSFANIFYSWSGKNKSICVALKHSF